MFKLSPLTWLKALSPVIIAASTFLAIEAPANAVPRISVSSSRHYPAYSYRQRRVSAPASLNITPPPGRHISLPRSSRSYYYRSRDRSRYDCNDRANKRYNRRYSNSRGYSRTVIINPALKY